MKSNLKHLFTLLVSTGTILPIAFPLEANAKTPSDPIAISFKTLDDLPAKTFLNQAALIAMKGTQTAGLAVEQASDVQLKAYAEKVVAAQSKITELLSLLAKRKGVVLPLSKPEGGQKPDGRVDSAPAILQDSSTNQNPAEQSTAVEIQTGDLKEKDVLQSVNALKNLKGKAFDRAFSDQAIADHKRAISLYEHAAASKDREIKAHVNKYLPLLKSNLTKLESIRKNIA